jgi:hypothetical protein
MNKKVVSYNKGKGHISSLHDGIMEIIFSFIGLNKNSASCRLVCKRWKKIFHKFLRQLIKEKSRDLEVQKTNNSKIEVSEENKGNLEFLLQTRKEYMKKVEDLPKKYSLFHRISDIGRLNNPPAILKYGCLAVFSLIFDKDDFKDLKKNGWTFCKKKMMMKKFPIFVRKVNPMNLTQQQLSSYTDLVQAMQITADYLWRESAQVALMFEWAEKILNFREAALRLNQEGKDILKSYLKENEIQNEIIVMQDILRNS